LISSLPNGEIMFPDIAKDDVFRLETRRLWLRWPRISDAPAIERYCSKWEVARHTARIPHPYPKGSGERFVYAAREANAIGRDLTLVLTTVGAPRKAVGAISLERRGSDRLTLGYALAPEVWGRGYATEAVCAIVDAAFALTSAAEVEASVHVVNPASRRVLEKAGFVHVGRGLRGAPARGAMVESDAFALKRADWAARSEAVPLEAAS
jgi:RimJ/RimL family protein N-acetyltransferase